MTAPAAPFIAWDNRFADATPVASSTALGAAANLADFRPYTQWAPSVMPATVTVNSGAAKAADSLAVYSHNLGSKGATIEVHGSTDNFGVSDVLVATFTPANDLPFVLQFASASYPYWRIRVTGASAPTLSVAALGAGLTMPIGLPYGFGAVDREAMGQQNISETGQPLGSAIMFEKWKQTLNFQEVDKDWLRNTFIPAWKAALRGKPFLFAWCLYLYPNEVSLVQVPTPQKFSAPQFNARSCSLQFDVEGIAP